MSENYTTPPGLADYVPRPWAVQCCGCSGLMLADGSTLEKGGLIQPGEKVAFFATHQEADTAAAANGWRTADATGPNHRCKKCLADRGGRRGAYVHIRDIERPHG